MSSHTTASNSFSLELKTLGSTSTQNTSLVFTSSKGATDTSSRKEFSSRENTKGENGYLSTSKNFNFAQLELSLPDTNAYEPETGNSYCRSEKLQNFNQQRVLKSNLYSVLMRLKVY